MRITKSDFESLRELQLRRHWLWPAVFSTNCHLAIWPWVTNGWTHPSQREDVRGVHPIIDVVADEYLRVRPEGGRFFISEQGAFYRDEAKQIHQFVEFTIVAERSA
jgi:hypothetical protein